MSKPPSNNSKAKALLNAKAATANKTAQGPAPSKAAAALKPQSTVKASSIWPWLALSVFWIALDQATKQWVQATISLGNVVEITGFFNLVHVMNPGAAFSFLASEPGWQKHFLSAVAVVASVVIVWMMRTNLHKRFAMFCLAGILGGALGNLIDRQLHGAVIDFLDFYYTYYHWPAFNVADIAISVGAVGLLIDELLSTRKSTKV